VMWGRRERGKGKEALIGRCSDPIYVCFEKGWPVCCCYGEMFEYRTHTAYCFGDEFVWAYHTNLLLLPTRRNKLFGTLTLN
jgi:hypothetical protein